MRERYFLKKIICCMVFFAFLISGCSTIGNWFSFLSDSNSSNKGNLINKKDFLSDKKTNKKSKEQYRLARHFQKQNRHKIAVKELLKVLQIDPVNYNAYNALGVSYDNLNQHDKAIHAYKTALKIRPNLDYVHNNIGYSNLMKGDFTTAAIAFKNAIKINPDNKIFKNNLALASAKLGKHNSLPVAIDQPKKENIPSITTNQPITQETISKPIDKALNPRLKINSDEESAPIHSSKTEDLYFAIQLGVYYNINDAIQTLKTARKKKYDCPYITKVERAKPYYRVRFGKYKTRSETEAFASHIFDKNGKPALTISESYPMKVFHAKKIYKYNDIDIQQTVLNETLNIEVINGNGIYHIAERLGSLLKKKGFNVIRPLNANHFQYQVSTIFYAPGNYKKAVRLSKEIPGFQIAGNFIKSTKLKTDFQILLGKDIAPFDDELNKRLSKKTKNTF